MRIFLFVIFVLLFSSALYAAGPAFPARIGGSVTVDGELLNAATGKGFVFRVTAMNGKNFLPPAEDMDGLNGAGKYIIDVPLHDPINKPGGAKPGANAMIRVLKNGKELKVVGPLNGVITIGKGGSITIIDLVISIQP